ncbi:protein REVERSION-TO-ETHYLENE SENSITIVITY1-like [Hevea brasiliensis]|uniref:protein REVERSION-TO-ETHYLENE SENSITIVITY1-like n=1 Tax=Hevea brasiliensis TaxID=3981 RepID=UPI0025FB1CA0|nr:protein REVERSION-TO-ETHYLENE SENSITIVITY1-like [Hevea brasiliensis]
MPHGTFSIMDVKGDSDIEHMSSISGFRHELWPLDEIDPNNAKFPCCLVWTPLPVVSWLAPFIGQVGICREDGTILYFAGSGFVNIDDFAFGPVARCLQLDRNQCCLPPNLAGHTCKHGYMHTKYGTAVTWDDALHSSMRHFEHRTYNLFTCNSHSLVANCLNRLCYRGSMGWNMINVAALILFKGHWIDWKSVIRSFLPFTVVICLGVVLVGWPFLIGLFSFSFLLIGWFLRGTYCSKNLLEF